MRKAKSDIECIDIMKRGADNICEKAVEMFYNNEYMLDTKTNRKFIEDWKATQRRISELCSMYKETIKKGAK